MSENQKLIRSELNIEKFMFWVTSNSTKKSHRIERSVPDEQGNRQTVSVTVGKINDTEVGVLRTSDMKTFYVLLRQWQELDRPSSTAVPFSIHELAHRLNLSWSGRTSTMLKASLERLRYIPIKWENSYFTKESRETESVLGGFTILSHLLLHERKKGQGAPTTKCEFRFDDRIISNLQQNYSKPLRLNEMLALDSELALMLYTRLDLWMADKTTVEKTLTNLLGELGLDLKTYPYPAQRKRLFTPPVAELEGRAISTGVISSATIVQTADGSDFKLVVKKSAKDAEQKNTEGPSVDGTLEQKLTSRGVSIGVARSLVRNHPAENIEAQIAHYDFLSKSSNIKNKGGWIKGAIENGYAIPDGVHAKRVAAEKEVEHREAIVAAAKAVEAAVETENVARQSQSANPELWDRILGQLAVVGMSRMGQGVVAQLVLVSDSANTITLAAPDSFARDFIRDSHLEKLREAVRAAVTPETETNVIVQRDQSVHAVR